MTSCPANAVTSRARADGFGAQYTHVISNFVIARRQGLPYCTNPWLHLEHKANASRLWAFVGGSSFGPPAHAATTAHAEQHAALAWRARPTDEAARLDVRRCYDAAPKDMAILQPPFAAGVNVAVHVRRGDIKRQLNPRFTSNGLIARCAAAVVGKFGRGAHVHIFSEGRDKSEFGPLAQVAPPDRLHWHLNAPIEATFHSLVMADALIIAHSSFSDAAAYLRPANDTIWAPTGVKPQLAWMYRHLRIEAC